MGLGTMSFMVLANVELFSAFTIERLYEIFKKDFIDSPLLLSSPHKSYVIDVGLSHTCKCPFGENPKQERFWHIITKTSNNRRDRGVNPCQAPENQRVYDAARAKRIHWIKPIIEQWLSDGDIVHFYERVNGKDTLHIWNKKLDFIVIIRKESRSSSRFLVSTYVVYRSQRQRYRKRWEKYEAEKPNGMEWF